MKLSTKGRYGLRCLLDLAVYSKGEHVPLNQIAERQDLSILYLEQVFSTLRKAGLVKSVKGAGGGYTLPDSASKISVGMILRALEGDISIVKSLNVENEESQNILETAIRTSLWTRIDTAIDEIIDSVTLEDLASDAKKLESDEHFMFNI